MRNCIIAQSGGPTAVINASAVGIYEKNLETKYFDKVYFGINGIEGILNKNIIDSDSLNKDNVLNLKQTPSSGLGSCRYKLADYKINSYDYDRVINILDEYEIDTLFYIGGNDSMDTVMKFSQYCKNTTCKIKFIGIPKTIDNDLMYTDHTPGFGSAANFISTAVLETYLDSSVYINNGIFIVETMGRDTGWLAASACTARYNGKPVADFIYLPEKAFNVEDFLCDVRAKFKEQNQVFIVASEGLKTEDGRFLSEMNVISQDNFGHSQLGGVGQHLRQLILDAGITTRVKALELGVLQRCAMHCASQIDIDEAFNAGYEALKYAADGHNGYMVAIKRESNSPYSTSFFLVEANKIANNVKYFPKEWINEKGNGVTEEAYEYFMPLLNGVPTLYRTNNVPQYKVFTK